MPEAEPVTEPEFHFDEIASLEPALVSLLNQLKGELEHNPYDTLISDDVGGRIPTLALWQIMRRLHPDLKLRVNFVSGGRYLPQPNETSEEESLQAYLRPIAAAAHRGLLVTQYTHTGRTLIKLSRELERAGLADFDVAVVDTQMGSDKLNSLEQALDPHLLYIGDNRKRDLHEKHQHLSGVGKPKNSFSPYPLSTITLTEAEGRQISGQEWREIFGVIEGERYQSTRQKVTDPANIARYEARRTEPLTEDERHQIQKNIVLARQDVNTLADRVIDQVYTEGK